MSKNFDIRYFKLHINKIIDQFSNEWIDKRLSELKSETQRFKSISRIFSQLTLIDDDSPTSEVFKNLYILSITQKYHDLELYLKKNIDIFSQTTNILEDKLKKKKNF